MLCGFYGWGVSVCISTTDYVVIALASFVIGWVVSTTKGTFCWGVSTFHAFRTIVLATAFDTRVWSVAVFSRVPVLLTACALRDVVFVCSRWFYVYELVLYGRNFVNFFVVLIRFKIHEKQVKWFLGYPVVRIYYVSGHVSLVEQVLSNFFYICGMVKIFEYHSIGSLLFQLVSVVEHVCFFEMIDESSISFWS